MSVKSGQQLAACFITSHPETGAATQADTTPTAVLVVDGVDNDAAVTISGGAGGQYVAACTLPALTPGQMVALRGHAVVATVSKTGIVWQDVADTALASDVSANVRTNLATELGRIDAAISGREASGAATAALADYDPPTRTEATSDKEAVITAVGGAVPVIDFGPVLEAIAGLPDDTDVADVLAALAAVKAKTDTLGTGAISVVSPVHTDGTWGPLVAGDDYVAGTVSELSVKTSGIDLSAGTVTCDICEASTGEPVVEALACTVTALVDDPDGYDRRVVVDDLTATQTATLTAYSYDVVYRAMIDGNRISFGERRVVVRQ